MPQRKAVYYNPPQLAVKYCSRPEKTLVWGRGTGKTTVNADIAETNLHEMPRSRGYIVGATYIQIMTLELPPMIAHWERLGYHKNIHYFIGQKPPAAWRKNWPSAWHMPQRVENLIWWYNGSVIQLISFDRKDTGSRGGSFDWGLGIEAALLSKPRLDRELLPAMRPTHSGFKKCRYNGSISYSTTMPFTQAGTWVFQAEEEQERETAKILGQGAYNDYKELTALKAFDGIQQKHLAKLRKRLAENKHKRKTLYLEATAKDNLYILGEGYFDRQRRNLSPLVYGVEIMNKRVNQVPNSFYNKFNESAHTYPGEYDYHHLDSLGSRIEDFQADCRNDGDLVKGVPLQLSFDFNADIFSLVVFQYLHSLNVVRFIKNFYAKEGEQLHELVERFCDYYHLHDQQFAIIWGDRNGHFERDNSRSTYYSDVMYALGQKNWKFDVRAPSHNIEHGLRFLMVNRMLSGVDTRMPNIEINAMQCKELVISLKATPTKRTDRKIEKDKGSERDEDIAPEHATHFSDTFDYALFQFFEWADIASSSYNFGGGFG